MSQTFQIEKSYYSHLFEVNKEWAKHPAACPDEKVFFKSDNDRIQKHLELVLLHLKNNPPANLSTSQKEKREGLLKALNNYTIEKSFPVNTKHVIRTPYFVDDKGVHCAVGQLMHVSGNDALVQAIKRDFNYSYLKDIKTPGVLEWCSTHGFTLEELKWIQPGYNPTAVLTAVSGGVNGPVTVLTRDFQNNGLIVAGQFDSLNLLPCLNIGYYSNNQLNCFGNGIEGVIYDVESNFESMFVFGEIINNGTVYPLAKYNGGTWSYISHPTYTQATASCALLNSNALEIAISPNGQPLYNEVWQYSIIDQNWTKIAEVNGSVLDMTSMPIEKAYVGHFNTITTYNAGQIDMTLNVNNVVMRSLSNQWYGLGTAISDTVKVVKYFGNAWYFGGTCSQNGSAVCLTRYLNNSLQTLVTPDNFSEFNSSSISIDALEFNYESDLFIGGEFNVQPVVGTMGKNFGKYDLATNFFTPLAILDQPVYSLTLYQNDIFIGGEFTSTFGSNIPYQYLAMTNGISSIDGPVNQEELTIFPNPFTNEVEVKNVETGTAYKLFNQQGQIVQEGLIMNQKINGLVKLSKGLYYLQLSTENGLISQKLMKQ